MGIKTNIPWCDSTWSPVTGCTPVSPACDNCYARRMSMRFQGNFDVTMHSDRLDQPLHWRKPRRIFVCSMSDLFHEMVPDEFITKVFGEIALCEQHTFMILTKRPARMKKYIDSTWGNQMYGGFPNVWLGVTAENQKQVDKRIPILLQTPAAVRFVSIEPMIGPVSLRWLAAFPENAPTTAMNPHNGGETNELDGLRRLDWVIVGGESGPGARPMQPDWARSIRDQCQAAGVPFFMKQMAKKEPIPKDLLIREFPK